jgi:hypothetical protein
MTLPRDHFRARTGRRLAVEPLEPRTLLAGDVSVEVVGGHLRVRGDEECNGLVIAQLGDNRYVVAGFEHDGAPTTINGSTDPLIVRGVKRNFDIDLKDGDDLLGIGNDVELLADLAEELGFGDALIADADLPELPDQRLRIGGSLIVRTKGGEDGVLINANVRRDAVIRTGLSSDGVALVNSRVGDDMILRTETGQDGVLIENAKIESHLNVHTGDDGDTLLVALSNIDNAVLNTGEGKDALGVSQTEFDRHLVLLTAQSNDDVVLQAVLARRIHLDTGSGDDNVAVDAEVDSLLAIFLGSGDDDLAIAGSSSARTALLRGGTGRDFLDVSDFDFARNVNEAQFEDVDEGTL